MPASLRFKLEPAGAELGRAERVLLAIGYGGADKRGVAGVEARAPLEVLGGAAVCKVISTLTPVATEEEAGFRLAVAGEALAGARELAGQDVEEETCAAYSDMLGIIARRDLHLHRVWNVLPDLNGGMPEFDRYMRFCRGRARAFDVSWGEGFEARLCANTAVGADTGPQLLVFLAGDQEGRPLENPRQVSAYRYPRRYGPRSPSFARALETRGGLLVSGTASIVGHESRHPGDVRAQTRETLANLEALDGVEPGGLPLLVVYLRRREDLADVEAILDERSPASERLVLRADLCRPELLVEIEGVGGALAAPEPCE